MLGVELACIARLNDGDGILKHLRPVEAAPEDLASEGARAGMVAALSTVYVPEEHASFLRRHTLEGNAIWALAV